MPRLVPLATLGRGLRCSRWCRRGGWLCCGEAQPTGRAVVRARRPVHSWPYTSRVARGVGRCVARRIDRRVARRIDRRVARRKRRCGCWRSSRCVSLARLAVSLSFGNGLGAVVVPEETAANDGVGNRRATATATPIAAVFGERFKVHLIFENLRAGTAPWAFGLPHGSGVGIPRIVETHHNYEQENGPRLGITENPADGCACPANRVGLDGSL